MNKIKMQEQFELALQDRQEGEIAMTYFKQYNRIGWLNETELSMQMEIWRDMMDEEDIKLIDMGEYNGFFTISFQITDPIADRENTLDPIARDIFHKEILGFMYVFPNKEERFVVLQYLLDGTLEEEE